MLNPFVMFAGFAFIFGTMVGSFLNVVIGRLPEGRSIVYPGSHCPHCGSPVRPYDNVPVLAWFWLRGKCRDCGTPISSLYPTIELMMGLFALLLFDHIFLNTWDFTTGNVGVFLLYFAFIAALVAESFIDLKYYIIPDSLSIYAAPVAIAGMWALEMLHPELGIGWKASILGACFGGGTLAIIALLWLLIRRYEGMGWGDVKLLLLIGAMVGPWPALPFIFLASAALAVFVGVPIGLIQGKGWKMALPFGPFLGLATLIWLFHAEQIVQIWLPGVSISIF